MTADTEHLSAATERGRRETEALRLLRDGYTAGQARDKTGVPLDRLRELVAEQPARPAAPSPAAPGACGHVTELPTRLLTEHPGNVRTDLGDLAELEQSILAQGILQPLLVTRGERGTYVVIGGHRRLAAAVAVGLPRVPVMVRGQLDGTKAVEAMLVENLQRADLHPLDEAAGYQRLVDAGMTQAQIGKAVGKHNAWISLRLTLLNLTPDEQAAMRRGDISIKQAEEAGRWRRAEATGKHLGGQKQPKPRRVPHFVITHPQAEAAASRCEHETTLKLGVACGPCWEQSIREDERRRLGRGGGVK